MPKIIVASRHYGGKQAGGMAKYIATRDNAEGLLRLTGYMAERPGSVKLGSHALFSDREDIVLAHAMREVSGHPGRVWSHVVSLGREDAERLNYNRAEAWRDLIIRQLPAIAGASKIDVDQLRWYAAFHNESHHPHLHLLVFSADGKQGFLSEHGIDQMKGAFANDIFRNEIYKLCSEQTIVRDQLRREGKVAVDRLFQTLQDVKTPQPEVIDLLLVLCRQIKDVKGKKVYGYLPKQVKKTVDEIVTQLAADPRIAELYQRWCDITRIKLGVYSDKAIDFPSLADNKEFRSIKNHIVRAVVEMDEQLDQYTKSMRSEADQAIAQKFGFQPPLPHQEKEAQSIANLAVDIFSHLSRMLYNDYQAVDRAMSQRIDSKELRRIMEKKAALGQKPEIPRDHTIKLQ